MDLKKTESGVKYVIPATKAEVFKPNQIRSNESNRSLGNVRAGKSLASVRRGINKTISGEIVEALKDGMCLEEMLQYSTDFYSHYSKESIPSFKFICKQLSSHAQLKHRNSISTEDSVKPVGEGKRDNAVTSLGTFITDVEKLSSVLNIATKFVEGILNEAFKAIGKLDHSKNFTVPQVPIKDLCLKSEEAKRDQPSLFNLANDFVENILNESIRRASNLEVLGMDRFQMYHSLDDFKVKDGLEIVAKCISKWSFNHNWFYRTLYHGRMISDESHSFFYTVRWSVPTPSYPVAQVTVDVNFTVEVMPLRTLFPFYIEVWYRMETDRSQHSAFNSNIFEKWLKTLVKRKLQGFKMFKF